MLKGWQICGYLAKKFYYKTIFFQNYKNKVSVFIIKSGIGMLQSSVLKDKLKGHQGAIMVVGFTKKISYAVSANHQ